MNNTFQKITFIFIFLSFSFISNAQKLTFKDGIATHNDKMYQAFVVQLEPNSKKVKKELKDWMDDKYGFELDGYGIFKKRDVLDAEQVMISDISNKKMDFYAEVTKNGSATELKIFGAFGYDIPISKEQYPNEYKAMKNMTINFLSEFLPEYYIDKIEDSEEMLSDLEKERKEMKEDLVENKEEIIELKKENTELAKGINSKSAAVKNTSEKLKTEEEKLKVINKKLKEKEKKTKENK